MEYNMSMVDRVIRLIIAIILLWALFTGKLMDLLGTLAWIVTFLLLINSILGVSFLYQLIGFSTKKK